MGHGSEEAVTPVVGTVMILGITVLGIGAILFWGAPTLQAIQDQNSATAMEGEFQELRRDTLDLTIDKASRLPNVVVEDGTLSIESGTRFLVSSDMWGTVAPYAGCSLQIDDWDTGDADSFDIRKVPSCSPHSASPQACPPGANTWCLEVFSVAGGTTQEKDWSSSGSGPYTISVSDGGVPEDLQSGDWLIRIKDDAADTVAQAWIISSDRISWELQTSVTDAAIHLEGGAILEKDGVRTFLVKAPAIQEDAFGSGDYVFRLPTYIPDTGGSITARATPSVFLGQVGNNHLRTSTASAEDVRFSFSGDLAEGWCNALLFRNAALTGDPYSVDGACTDTTPTVVYEPAASFAFELIHARVTARLQI